MLSCVLMLKTKQNNEEDSKKEHKKIPQSGICPAPCAHRPCTSSSPQLQYISKCFREVLLLPSVLAQTAVKGDVIAVPKGLFYY